MTQLTRQERKAILAECKAEGHEWADQGTYSECKVCAKTKRNTAASVKVQRVVSDTGEIIEQTVSRSRFKPERQRLVTQDFQRKVLAGDHPSLIFPGWVCPVEVGHVIELTSNVSITVHRITKTKGGDHRVRYIVRDFRPTLMRRTPKMFEPPETDHLGIPIPHDEAAIEAARLDGNYTQDSRQAVPESGEEVDIQYRRVLGVKSRARQVGRKRKEQPMEGGQEDVRALSSEMRELAKRAVRMGVDPAIVLAPIAGEIAKAHREMSTALPDEKAA